MDQADFSLIGLHARFSENVLRAYSAVAVRPSGALF